MTGGNEMIGIIGAMDEEIELLKQNMTDEKEETIANCLFIRGTLCGKEVVLLKSGIGKTNAAMAATIMYERYQPEFTINTGSAGGFKEDLNVGDLVISNEVLYHDVDVTAFDYVYGQVPGMPEAFAADPHLIERTKEAAKELGIPHCLGLIATGDVFMADPGHVAAARERFPHMIAAEMEAAAIAQVSFQYGKPFVIIRALSDIAGKESAISFDEFLEKAAKHAAQLIMKVLEAAA